MNVYPKGVCVQGVHSHTCPTCHHFLVSWPVHAPKRKEQQTKAKKGKRKRKKEKKKKKKEITNTTRPQTCIQIPTNISSATLPFVSSVSSVSSSSSVSSFPCRVPLLAVAVCSQLLFFFGCRKHYPLTRFRWVLSFFPCLLLHSHTKHKQNSTRYKRCTAV